MTKVLNNVYVQNIGGLTHHWKPGEDSTSHTGRGRTGWGVWLWRIVSHDWWVLWEWSEGTFYVVTSKPVILHVILFIFNRVAMCGIIWWVTTRFLSICFDCVLKCAFKRVQEIKQSIHEKIIEATQVFTSIFLTQETTKMPLMLPLVWIMVLLHLWVGLSLFVILIRALQEFEGPQRLLPPFKAEHLARARTSQPPISVASPRFPHGWLKYLVHPDSPTIIGWTIGHRVQWNQFLGRSPIRVLFRP